MYEAHSEVLETGEFCRVRLIHDLHAEHANPRDCDNNVTTIYGYHPHYEIGDETLPSGGLPDIYCPACKGSGHPMADTAYAQLVPREECSRCEGFGMIPPTVDEWLASIGAIAAAPLFMLDHSCITYRTGAVRLVGEAVTREDTRSAGVWAEDSHGWDTSFVGFVVVTEADLAECCGDDAEYRTREWLTKAIDGEVDEYAKWAEGDVWGYVVEALDGSDLPDGMGESCWGFIGYDYAAEEARGVFASAEKAAGESIAGMIRRGLMGYAVAA